MSKTIFNYSFNDFLIDFNHQISFLELENRIETIEEAIEKLTDFYSDLREIGELQNNILDLLLLDYNLENEIKKTCM